MLLHGAQSYTLLVKVGLVPAIMVVMGFTQLVPQAQAATFASPAVYSFASARSELLTLHTQLSNLLTTLQNQTAGDETSPVTTEGSGAAGGTDDSDCYNANSRFLNLFESRVSICDGEDNSIVDGASVGSIDVSPGADIDDVQLYPVQESRYFDSNFCQAARPNNLQHIESVKRGYNSIAPDSMNGLSFEGGHTVTPSESLELATGGYTWTPGSLDSAGFFNWKPFQTHGNATTESLSISSEVARLGSQSLRIAHDISERTWGTKSRAELMGPQVGADQARWYGFSVYFPADVDFQDGHRFILSQIWENTRPCTKHAVPPVSIQMMEDRMQVRHYSGRVAAGGIDYDSGSGTMYQLIKGVPRDEWIDIYYYMKPGLDNDGEVAVYAGFAENGYDPEPLYEATDINVGYDCHCDSYFKVGLYQGGFPQSVTHTYYIDEMRWGPTLDAVTISPKE